MHLKTIFLFAFVVALEMSSSHYKKKTHPNHISPFLTSTYNNYQIVPYVSQPISVKPKRSYRSYWASIPFKKILLFPVVIIKGLPTIISSAFLLLMLYLFFTSVYILQKDVSHRIIERRNALKSLIEQSKINYNLNKCDPSTRVPALQKLCTKWECQMKRSVDSVEISRIVAQVLGEVLDAFVKSIGFKTLGYIIIIFIVYLYFRKR